MIELPFDDSHLLWSKAITWDDLKSSNKGSFSEYAYFYASIASYKTVELYMCDSQVK